MKSDEFNRRMDIQDIKLNLIMEALKIDKEKIRERLQEILIETTEGSGEGE